MSRTTAELASGQTASHKLLLPQAPVTEAGPVKAWLEPVEMTTYLPGTPDKNPLFLERRVYQGSSGRVYPLPCIDRIATEAATHTWQAVHLENDFIRLMILPQIGGRIHVGLDKLNDYDFFYRQNVIKPALVGLAGPWMSGGVEFNWPQHHRPATFMPVEVAIDRGQDGSVTVWCSDHDPMQRMKGMHGICLYPDRALLELKVRLYNRTTMTQTFLWWANVATRVHEKYQSFFPPDVRFVADHAKRAIAQFPLVDRPYYGIDYPERAQNGVPENELPPRFQPDGSYAANDLSWFANIPVPTSYMITSTQEDFFGGYDHARQAGVVHVANHHIAPGKKQWTWGNHEFGYAWDRSLTDEDGPYIELMAGAYTDNQPDFSFLAPGETKSFSQYWYPIREIGPPSAANLDAALRLEVRDGRAWLRLFATHEIPAARVELLCDGKRLKQWQMSLSPRHARMLDLVLPENLTMQDLEVEVTNGTAMLLRYAPREYQMAPAPKVATEPLEPQEISNPEQLYLTGLHLKQYRHATRSPEPYWQEALRRDEGDSRANTALGTWRLERGELRIAEAHFRRAIDRLTERNPNPADADAFYYLGITLRHLGSVEEAYGAFYKATWVAAWRGPAYHALAELDARAGRYKTALEHVKRALRADADNNNAASLLISLLNQLGHPAETEELLREACARDPLDVWFRLLDSGQPPSDAQQCIDLALDHMRAGMFDEADFVLQTVNAGKADGAAPIAFYLRALIAEERGEIDRALELSRQAEGAPPTYVFPVRLEEMLALEKACRRNPEDARAHFYLGNFLYDRRRHEEAIAHWEASAALWTDFPTVWRNLGLGFFNNRHDQEAALAAYDRAFAADPNDARVLYERDQLWKRVGMEPEKRLAELERYPMLIALRDDLSVEFVTLLNQSGTPDRALELLAQRRFQPWEGGEGLVLGQFVRSNLLLGQRALAAGDPSKAATFFSAALQPPHNLSEANHLLANRSEVYYWLGVALHRANDEQAANRALFRAAKQHGDFQQMSVRSVSETTYWSAKAEQLLGNHEAAKTLFQRILDYAGELEQASAKIDYFATSLPSMLLFQEDLALRQHTQSTFLKAQGLLGLGQTHEATELLKEVLALDINHMAATSLLRELMLGGVA